jgi:hypothetical protein
VRDLQLTRADVRALVLDVWAEKLAATHTAKLKMPQVSMAHYLGSQLLRRADNCPQPQEARPRSHARTTFQFNLTFRLLGSSVWSEMALNWLFPYPLITPDATSPQPMVGLVPIAQTSGMIRGQHTASSGSDGYGGVAYELRPSLNYCF